MSVASPPTRRIGDLVAQQPGLTAAALARAQGGRRATALEEIRLALERGEVHQAVTRVPTRGGARRSATGIYPGPGTGQPPLTTSMPGDYLRPVRARLGLPASVLAQQLGVSPGLIYHWESGRQPIPASVVERLPVALERAQFTQDAQQNEHAAARERARRDQRAQALRAVTEQPGLTLSQLAERLGVPRQALSLRLNALISRGEVHHGRPTQRPARGGYVGLGFHPGPPPALNKAVPSLHDIAAAAAAAGWTGSRVAKVLDVPTTTWFTAAKGSSQLPRYVQPGDLVAALEEITAGARDLEDRMLSYVTTKGGVTYEDLTRHTFGRTLAVRTALGSLLDRGAVHYSSKLEVNRDGLERYLKVIRPGPAPVDQAAPLSGQELEQLRRSRHVTKKALGSAIGVSKTQVTHWESGAQPVSPGRAAQLRAYLEPLPEHATPLVDQVRVDDADQRAAVLAYVAQHPGVTRRRVCAEALAGSMQRRLAIVAALTTEGELVEQPARLRRSDGVPFTAQALYLPGAAPGGAE